MCVLWYGSMGDCEFGNGDCGFGNGDFTLSISLPGL